MYLIRSLEFLDTPIRFGIAELRGNYFAVEIHGHPSDKGSARAACEELYRNRAAKIKRHKIAAKIEGNK